MTSSFNSSGAVGFDPAAFRAAQADPQGALASFQQSLQPQQQLAAPAGGPGQMGIQPSRGFGPPSQMGPQQMGPQQGGPQMPPQPFSFGQKPMGGQGFPGMPMGSAAMGQSGGMSPQQLGGRQYAPGAGPQQTAPGYNAQNAPDFLNQQRMQQQGMMGGAQQMGPSQQGLMQAMLAQRQQGGGGQQAFLPQAQQPGMRTRMPLPMPNDPGVTA